VALELASAGITRHLGGAPERLLDVGHDVREAAFLAKAQAYDWLCGVLAAGSPGYYDDLVYAS